MRNDEIIYELITAIAGVDGVEPTSMDYQLADYIDPDILYHVLSTDAKSCELHFEIPGHEVAVTGTGEIFIDDIRYQGGALDLDDPPLASAGNSIDATEEVLTDFQLGHGDMGFAEGDEEGTPVLPDLCFVLDADGTYRDVLTKPGEESLLIDDPTNLVNRSIHEILPTPAAETIHDGIKQSIATNLPQTFSYELPVQEGRRTFAARSFVVETASKERCIFLAVRDAGETWVEHEHVRN